MTSTATPRQPTLVAVPQGAGTSRELSTAQVQRAVAALTDGGMVVVIDDADRENEGDLVVAAEKVTPEQMAFLVRHTTGIVCAPMPSERADELRLPQMVTHNTDAHSTAFTVTVDAVGTGTGVSAADRAATFRALADPATQPGGLRRPGHVFPLRAREGGVLVRAGHTEAAVDLLRMAGLSGVGVIGEITADDGGMRSGADLRAFAAAHDLLVLDVADLVRHRRATERLVEQVAASEMPTAFGEFRAVAYRNVLDGVEHLALVMGDVAAAGHSERGALVRVHSECLTGDILGSLRCDCGAQLEQALAEIAFEGCGAVVYLQEAGLDTVDANTAQGLPVDSRSYGVGAQIVGDLGIRRLRLITNNPAKYGGLDGYGLDVVGRVALPVVETPHNVRYLRTKRERMHHELVLATDALADARA
jgi:3,4-dihydroxy 2-butanone 4-phosphate synthase/GTP cyclohydrolase II